MEIARDFFVQAESNCAIIKKMATSQSNPGVPGSQCIDPTVGDILSGWRYDISGLHTDMRRDYEEHLQNCSHCQFRQNLHRTIDVLLIGFTTLSVTIFLLALAVLHRFEPLRGWVLVHLQMRQISLVVTMQLIAVLGLLASTLAWILVAVATPAPQYLSEQAKALQQRLPGELRERLAKHSA